MAYNFYFYTREAGPSSRADTPPTFAQETKNDEYKTYFLYGIVDGLLVTTERVSAADVNVVGTLDGGGGLYLQGVLEEKTGGRAVKNTEALKKTQHGSDGGNGPGQHWWRF